MKRIIIVVALALVPAATADAHVVTVGTPRSAADSRCTSTFVVQDYRSYASRVYRRRTVRARAHRLMERMHVCQRDGFVARKAVGRYHAKYLARREAMKLDWACTNSNPVACILLASRRYGTPASHLISCARSEGGLGPRSYQRMNTQGSGAGGVFQFMRSTFTATIRRMGLSPKPWLSARWQAMAAAWKFRVDGTGEWTGPGC